MSELEILESQSVFRGRVVHLKMDRVRLPNGRYSDQEVVQHPGATAIAALTGDNEVLLVRQYRYAVGDWLLELPAGKLDTGEVPEACAARELEEETGFVPGKLVSLGWIWPSPGFCDEKIWLFLAADLERGRQSLEPDENLTVERLPLQQALEKVRDGEICDAKSVCALMRAAELLG